MRAMECRYGRVWYGGTMRKFIPSPAPCAAPPGYRAPSCQGVDVSMVSRGDSTLRGHFPGDLVSLEKGMGGESWRKTPRLELRSST